MIKTVLSNVLVTEDGGQVCYDTTISAADIVGMLEFGKLKYDPKHQRNEEAKGVNKRRVKTWADDALKGEGIFGQLTWNYRPESSSIRFIPSRDDSTFGSLEVNGIAFAPDSWHRISGIAMAANLAAKMGEFGQATAFSLERRFSLRIWNVPESFEDRIFYAMNQEGEKAPASRSKMLHQANVGQEVALAFVQASPHLLGDGAQNVEIHRNSVSAGSPKLVAFNTISTAIEGMWKKLGKDANQDEVVAWLVKYWDALAEYIPALREVDLPVRQEFRRTSIAGSAVAIHGYIGLASEMYQKGRAPDDLFFGENDWEDLFSYTNPELFKLEIVATSERSTSGFVTRNSHPTQDAMTRLLARKIGLGV